jgi:hypothetical protein
MRIKQISNYPRIDLDAGAVLDWPDTEAVRMIAAGLVERADPVESFEAPKPLERATAGKAGRKESR